MEDRSPDEEATQYDQLSLEEFSTVDSSRHPCPIIPTDLREGCGHAFHSQTTFNILAEALHVSYAATFKHSDQLDNSVHLLTRRQSIRVRYCYRWADRAHSEALTPNF